MVRVATTSGILMTVRLLVDSKNLRGSTLVTGFHGVGQTGYIATSYMIHALKAERIGFIDVSNPPPWVGTAEGGLVTPFEVYRRGKTVLVKLEFSPTDQRKRNSQNRSLTGQLDRSSRTL